ncbi:MAG: Zn-ribbon domain-containing protein [Nanoarchaeota archaeon]
MPHQCLKCEKVYDNTSNAIIVGCPNCGSKLFLYIKNMPKDETEIELNSHKKDMIIQEISNFVDIEETQKPIIFKLENIRVLSPGKYEIDINQLMKKEKPIVYKVDEGTYVIDLDFLRDHHNGNSKYFKNKK